MDTKFRKLISRLSIKEKKLGKTPYPRMVSISPIPFGRSDEEVKGREKTDLKLGQLETMESDLTFSQNILTNVHFPCPTLLRKSKSMSENFYEEVTFRDRKVSANGSEDSDGRRSECTSESTDENNNLIGEESERSSSRSSDEGTLQGIEEERRRLIAAQRVRAKYAENWIDGQVVDESILGDNKEKTKLYWESRMRQEQFDRETQKLNGSNKLRTSSANCPVIQKINAEIQELHRREKELRSKSISHVASGSTNHSHEEEDDVFSSNGSSVDEFEQSESPRLESGFYSNLGEDEAQLMGSPDSLKPSDPPVEIAKILVPPVASKVEDDVKPMGVSAELNFSMESLKGVEVSVQSPFQITDRTQSSNVAEDTESAFTFQKETPIEKEIRLANEREQEYRLRRLSSIGELQQPPILKTPVALEARVQSPILSPKVKSPDVEEKRFGPTKGLVRNIQAQLAADRLRKEILEVKRREEELQTIHRTVSMSSLLKRDYAEDDARSSPISTDTAEEPTLKPAPVYVVHVKNPTEQELTVEVDHPKTLRGSSEPLKELEPGLVENERKPSVSSDQPMVYRSPQFRNHSTSGMKQRLNSFNSMQRYLLKSSVQLRIANNFKVPPSPKPVVNPESTNKEEEVEPETPRRKLIPATHKIQNELREMKEREKELALIRTRSFKSTPNLLAEFEEKAAEVEEVTPTASKAPVFAPLERKRSTLINQWEQIIQNNVNSN